MAVVAGVARVSDSMQRVRIGVLVGVVAVPVRRAAGLAIGMSLCSCLASVGCTWEDRLHRSRIVEQGFRTVMGLVSVVGGAGFVGNRLAAILRAAGHDVRVFDVVAPDTGEFTYRLADVRDRDSLVAALDGSDVVYNLAAVHRDDVKPVSLYDEVNVTGGGEPLRCLSGSRRGANYFHEFGRGIWSYPSQYI